MVEEVAKLKIETLYYLHCQKKLTFGSPKTHFEKLPDTQKGTALPGFGLEEENVDENVTWSF